MTIKHYTFRPPTGYQAFELATYRLPAGTFVYRCYGSHRPPEQSVYFGAAGSGRFSDPRMELGVMYVGKSFAAALVETLLHSSPEVDAIPIDDLKAIAVAELSFERNLELVKFSGPELKRNHTTAEIFTCPHSESQLWASDIIDNPRDYAGIYYPCRHNSDVHALALFDGRTGDIVVNPLGTLDALDETYEVLGRHGVGVF